jgi:signal transduction histidine kinase
LIYLYIARTLIDHDRTLVVAELRELSRHYSQEGLQSTEDLIKAKITFHRQHPFSVRIADGRNKTLGGYYPSPWTEFNTRDLGDPEKLSEDKWMRLNAISGDFYFEFAAVRLNDGNWMQVGMSSEIRDKILDRLQSTFYAVLGIMMTLGFIGGWLLARYTLHPIQNLITSVKAVAGGKMNARVIVVGKGGELDELAIQYNKMLDKIEKLLIATKNSLDNVAHDIRTPITRLRINAEKVLQDPENMQDKNHALLSCLEETDRINVMLDTLLNISEVESGIMQIDLQLTNVVSLVENVVAAYLFVADEKDIRIDVVGDSSLQGWLDSSRMSQVLANLLDNAIKYTPNGGQVLIEISIDAPNLLILIQDSGIGILDEDLEKIWDRLYRGTQPGNQRGLGLGLSLARAIIEAHNGTIEASSVVGKGSTFKVRVDHVFSDTVNMKESRSSRTV